MEKHFPVELESFIDAQIASGQFASRNDVMSEALRQMQERERRREWLRKEVQLGLDQIERGEVIELNSEEEVEAFFAGIWARVEQRLEAPTSQVVQ